MKKVLCAGLIFMTVAFSAQGVGLYFDAGIGVGFGWTKVDGKDAAAALNKNGRPDELAVDLGMKLGFGPFDTIPIHVVGVLGGIGHRIYDSGDYIQFNSYLIGPGVIYYPAPFLQIAASLGLSFAAVDNSLSQNWHDSKGGFAGDISAAFDLGAGNNDLLGGIRFFGSTNTLEITGNVINSSMISFFLRYAFRHKR
jgi:hypothetical protein